MRWTSLFALQNLRVMLVDALRGFALSGIMLLHSIEQFNLRGGPRTDALWSFASDRGVWENLFFIFGGKAYAIFSLLFGFTFWVMYSSRIQKGYDFSLRFLWRMVLLFGFGLIHSVFYAGDILILYAALAGVLVMTRRWSDKAILVLAVLLLIQPLQLWYFFNTYFDPTYTPPANSFYPNFAAINPHLRGDSFWALVNSNCTDGLLANVLWSWDVGRVFQAPGLFLLGMLAARRRIFATPSLRFWLIVLATSAVAFAVLHTFRVNIGELPLSQTSRRAFRVLVSAYDNLAFMLILVSGFTLLWRLRSCERVLSWFAPYGRMSLTNYLTQSIVGTAIYYGWGFGLYRYFGHTLSASLGLALLIALIFISRWWLTGFAQGPLETLWSRGTWAGGSIIQ